MDWDEDKKLHHFLLAFETIRKTSEGQTGAKEQLQLYYEQLKQSILENDSYVDALLELSDVIYTVNLTESGTFYGLSASMFLSGLLLGI